VLSFGRPFNRLMGGRCRVLMLVQALCVSASKRALVTALGYEDTLKRVRIVRLLIEALIIDQVLAVDGLTALR